MRNMIFALFFLCELWFKKYSTDSQAIEIDSSTIKSATEAVSTTIDIAQKIDIIIKMASQFVVLAKKEMTDATGEEKRNWVIEKLKTICDGIDIVLDDDSLRAINEGAYAEMKSKEAIESTSEKW